MMPRKISGDRMAELSPDTIRRLDAVLPSTWSRGNPVDIMSDASADRYAEALEVLLEDRQVDAVLVLSCPVAVVSGSDAAEAVARTYRKRLQRPRPPVLLTSWLGEQTAAEARRIFYEHRIPTYKTPYDAVRAFTHMVRYQKNQEMLMETPPSIPEYFAPNLQAALKVIEEALAGGRRWLTHAEVHSVLTAYGIRTVPPLAPQASKQPVPCPDSSMGLGNSAAPMSRPVSHELMIHVVEDAQFGPVIRFGHGGRHAGEIQDRAVALPPLNMHLAREVIERTRICRLLRENETDASVTLREVALSLIKISQLVCDIAEITEIEINPLRVDQSGIVASGARIRVARSAISASERLAIRPYPKELEDWVTLRDGETLQIRPIRPEDEPGFHEIVESLTPEARRMRFLHPVEELSHREAARLTQIDYDREMALVAASTDSSGVGGQKLYGSVRIICDPDGERAEFAILVHSKASGKGLGKLLMQHIIDHARSRGIREISGQVLCENIPMLKVCKALGFNTRRDVDDPGVIVVCFRG
jgi:acetyltransferase